MGLDKRRTTPSLEERAYRWVNETAWQFEEIRLIRDLLRHERVEKARLATAAVPSLIEVYRQQMQTGCRVVPPSVGIGVYAISVHCRNAGGEAANRPVPCVVVPQ